MHPLPDPATLPCSPLDEVCCLKYFPRMLGKIRLHAAGVLWSDLHANLGIGMDGWCTAFLRVSYQALTARVLEGGSDEDILQWCQEQAGRELSDIDKMLWNQFTLKLGWNDRATPLLQKRKRESGLGDREDIQTMAQYIDADEGRMA